MPKPWEPRDDLLDLLRFARSFLVSQANCTHALSSVFP